MKRKFATAFVLAGGLTLFGAPPDHDKDKMKGASVTGCLSMGSPSNTNEFVITEDGTNRKITVTGTDLAKHNNHKVKLTGDHHASKTDHMTVTKVEHISETCTPK